MLINGTEKFLLKGKADGNKQSIKALYELYGNQEISFHDAAVLHQEILISYNPEEALKIYNPDFFELKPTATDIEAYYLHSLSRIVEYLYHNELFYLGVHWAKKGLDLFDLFNSTMTENQLAKVMKDYIEYQRLVSLFKLHESYFDADFYYPRLETNGFVFEWEAEFTPAVKPVNDN